MAPHSGHRGLQCGIGPLLHGALSGRRGPHGLSTTTITKKGAAILLPFTVSKHPAADRPRSGARSNVERPLCGTLSSYRVGTALLRLVTSKCHRLGSQVNNVLDVFREAPRMPRRLPTERA